MIGILLAAAAALQPVAATPRRVPPPVAAKPAEIELWVLDQISFPITEGDAFTATLKALEPDHSMEAVATRLALLKVKFERTIVTVDTSRVEPELIAKLKTLPPTEPFALPEKGRVTINVVLSRRTRPAGAGDRAPPPPANPAAGAEIDRLLDVMDVASQFDSQVNRILDAMLPAIVADKKDRTDEVRKIIGEELRVSFAKSRPLLIAQARELYLARFSTAELNQLVGFYESPLGRKLTSMSPGIGAAMSQFGQQMSRAATLDAQPRIIARLRAAKIETPRGLT